MIIKLQADSPLGSKLSIKKRDSPLIKRIYDNEEQWKPFKKISDESFTIKKTKRDIKAPKRKIMHKEYSIHQASPSSSPSPFTLYPRSLFPPPSPFNSSINLNDDKMNNFPNDDSDNYEIINKDEFGNFDYLIDELDVKNNFGNYHFPPSYSSLPSSSIDQEIESVLFSDAASFTSSTTCINDILLSQSDMNDILFNQSDDMFSEIETTLFKAENNHMISSSPLSSRTPFYSKKLIKLDNHLSKNYENLSLNMISSRKRGNKSTNGPISFPSKSSSNCFPSTNSSLVRQEDPYREFLSKVMSNGNFFSLFLFYFYYPRKFNVEW